MNPPVRFRNFGGTLTTNAFICVFPCFFTAITHNAKLKAFCGIPYMFGSVWMKCSFELKLQDRATGRGDMNLSYLACWPKVFSRLTQWYVSELSRNASRHLGNERKLPVDHLIIVVSKKLKSVRMSNYTSSFLQASRPCSVQKLVPKQQASKRKHKCAQPCVFSCAPTVGKIP